MRRIEAVYSLQSIEISFVRFNKVHTNNQLGCIIIFRQCIIFRGSGPLTGFIIKC